MNAKAKLGVWEGQLEVPAPAPMGIDNAALPSGRNLPAKWRLCVKPVEEIGKTPNTHEVLLFKVKADAESAMSNIWDILIPDCDPDDYDGIVEAVRKAVAK